MAETWEDCVALLRAGASPSEVLPKLRELMNSEPPPQSTKTKAPCSSDNSQSSSIFCYRVNGIDLKLPYSQPPPTLWQELSNYPDAQVFDSESVIDVLQEFSPIFIGPPEKEILEMLNDLGRSSSSNEGYNNADKDLKEDEERYHSETVSTFLQKILSGEEQAVEEEVEDGGDFKVPMLSEAEWAWVLSRVDFDRAGKDNLSDLVGYVNQCTFSRVILHSIVPVLANEIEREDFLELVSTVASSAEVYSMTHDELSSLMNVYRDMESKGALAQLGILCCDEVQ